MTTYSLDADIVTKLLKKHPGNKPVLNRFRQELQRNSLFILCPVVYFEIYRQLVFKQAAAQLSAFEMLAGEMLWREFTAATWRRASSLWSALRAHGKSHNDADVLIAAHTLEYEATLVTGNTAHFRDTNVRVEDWTR